MSEAEGGWTADGPQRRTSPLQHHLNYQHEVQQRGLRDGAWLESPEAHHCLTTTTTTQLPVWLLFAPKLRRQAFAVFIVFSSSNFRKCTTLFVRWPKCKCPKN